MSECIIPPTILLRIHEGGQMPLPQTSGAAGLDLHAAEGIVMQPHVVRQKVYRVPLGLAVAIPLGHVGLICGRSGKASDGLLVLPAPGVIDPDYRGQLHALLCNLSENVMKIEAGDRVAQLLVVPNVTTRVQMVSELPPTDRGDKGFGSTGK